MTENEIVPVETMQLGVLVVDSPSAIIRQATAISKELARLIEDRKLFTSISGKKYVRVEGWSTLGAMLGVLPREVEKSVIRHEDGSYEATVELIRTSDGATIGRGSAIVGMDEQTWSKRPEYARRSMSITRATGKAFRLGFSWIMALAGYEPTPAEEITEEVIQGQFVDQPPKGNGHDKQTIDPRVQALIDCGAAADVPEAAGMLNLLKPHNMPIEDLQKLGKLYRGWRDTGADGKVAAEKAHKGEMPK